MPGNGDSTPQERARQIPVDPLPDPPPPRRARRLRSFLLFSIAWFLPMFRLMATTDEGEVDQRLRTRALEHGEPVMPQIDLTISVLAGPLASVRRSSDPEVTTAGEVMRPTIYGDSRALGIAVLLLVAAIGPSLIAIGLLALGPPRGVLFTLAVLFLVLAISTMWHAVGLTLHLASL